MKSTSESIVDSKATIRDQSICNVAIQALNAGSDLLLMADIDEQIEEVANSIIDAVSSGTLSKDRLCEASENVRVVGDKYSK